MDVNTGEILAMVTKPDYDLNEPFAITDAVEERYPEIKEELEDLNKEIKKTANKIRTKLKCELKF